MWAKIRNPKLEIRNKFKARNPKSQTKRFRTLVLRIWDLFRISDFGFRIWRWARARAWMDAVFFQWPRDLSTMSWPRQESMASTCSRWTSKGQKEWP